MSASKYIYVAPDGSITLPPSTARKLCEELEYVATQPRLTSLRRMWLEQVIYNLRTGERALAEKPAGTA
jgi:hypothetical protein